MKSAPTSSIIALTAALTLVAAWGCSGKRTFHEQGEECWDGKDNDDDGAVDCKDPDCKAFAICGNVKLDGGKLDGPVKKDTQPVKKDIKPPPDTYKPPTPDKAPTSSYGQRCAYTKKGQLCADGKTTCILGKKSNSKGYRTVTCNGNRYDSCPAGPQGTAAKCLFTFAGTDYCAFLCKYLGKPYTCPSSLGCYYFSANQKFCWS